MNAEVEKIVAAIGVACLSLATKGIAADYTGQVRLGAINSQIRYSEPIQGEESNDISIISTRLFLEGEDLFSRRDGFVLDLRDKYDFFGKANSEILSLESSNEFIIRQAAYKKPWEVNRGYYTVGRFSIPEAGIIANDGGEYGYRLNRSHRVGGFIGIAPEDVVTPASVSPDERGFDGNQGGIYSVYKRENAGRMDTTFMINTLAQAPSFELDDFVNKVYYYHQGIFNLGFKHRVSSYVNFDVMPSASLRRAYVTHGYYLTKFRVRSSFTRITAEDYRLKKDIRDDLEPSTLNALKSTVTQRFNRDLNFTYGLEYAQRAADGLSRTELEVGATYRGMLRRRLSLGAYYGQRDNFESDDNYIKLSTRYYQNFYSLSAAYIMETENFDTGDTLNPQTIHLDFAFYTSDKLRGSTSYILSTAEDRTVTSLMFSLGYQFGKESTSPTRKRAMSFEEL
ncbi:hypothetical protein [Pseudobacteriovorax antillogorgiicola]|uniref:Uncharacterized protein n=1 Tax=Pseudobacteriovorax antillogorgiicola TaxID=1513793 RepID=A0A1Y6BYS2_9BACT|nr:hypothetical protein [Pseudobacteriovorax antillogorgiicola]TCS51268.1 hypothetical protein EDD56_111153 [Pseudobacteriovorax antillogorgiicola]SMF36390.1 hypothetical protein SAMN06296036_11125 [Pseudobacteriovorax antillogorgiicola]